MRVVAVYLAEITDGEIFCRQIDEMVRRVPSGNAGQRTGWQVDQLGEPGDGITRRPGQIQIAVVAKKDCRLIAVPLPDRGAARPPNAVFRAKARRVSGKHGVATWFWERVRSGWMAND